MYPDFSLPRVFAPRNEKNPHGERKVQGLKVLQTFCSPGTLAPRKVNIGAETMWDKSHMDFGEKSVGHMRLPCICPTQVL